MVLDAAGALGRPGGATGARPTGDPTAHAEIEAIRRGGRAVGDLAAGGLHAGRHAGAVHHVRGRGGAARLARLVYGAADPKAGAAGSLWDVLRDRRLGQTPKSSGVSSAEECGALLREFFAGAGPKPRPAR